MPWNLAQIFKWAKNFVKNLRGQVASSIEIIFPSFSETFFKKCNISSQMISTVQTIYDPPFCYNGLWILMGLSFSWWVGYNICRYWPFYSSVYTVPLKYNLNLIPLKMEYTHKWWAHKTMMTPVLMDELGKKLPIFFKLFFLLKLEIHNFFNVRGEMSDLFSIFGMIFWGQSICWWGICLPRGI